MEVEDPDGEWQLEIDMPENRMGHIAAEARERTRLVKEGKMDKEQEPLPVEYILATSPGLDYEGRVTDIHKIANVKGEEGNTVQIKVAIDKKDLLADNHELKSGAGVTTKIYCGRASVGYVWLHDLIAFVHTKILFPL